MHTTISQMLYPDRQAFFKKLALSLPPQPAIKIGPAPLPAGKHKAGLRNLRNAVISEEFSAASKRRECREKRRKLLQVFIEPRDGLFQPIRLVLGFDEHMTFAGIHNQLCRHIERL